MDTSVQNQALTSTPTPIKPNTRMNISGKIKLKITAEGLLKIALKLPLVMASIALI